MAKLDPAFDWKLAPVQFTERKQFDCSNTEIEGLLAMLRENNIAIESVIVLDGGYRVVCRVTHYSQSELL